MTVTEIESIIEALEELQGDRTVPKNVKSKIGATIFVLKEKVETSIKVSKALSELEEIAEDTNMQSYTRTQIWNIVSMLEAV